MHLARMRVVLTPVLVRFGLGRHLLGSFFRRGVLDLGRRNPRGVQSVRFVPSVGIFLQALKNSRHVVAQTVLRFPIQVLFGR